MGGFRIYQDNNADFTVISNKFIDEFMEDANDAQLKVYLYLMRMINANLETGISDIADRFNFTEKDVLRALHYWEKKGLISIDYDAFKNVIGVHLLSVTANQVTNGQSTAPTVSVITTTPINNVVSAPAERRSVPSNVTPLVAPISVAKPDFTKPEYSKDDIIRFKNNNESNTSNPVFIAEQYLNKMLSVAELTTLLYISDTLKFSDDLIDYLLQYCIGRDKKDYRYIEAVALDWAQSGITTPEQAANHSRKYDRIVYDIMNALGKNSAPSSVEVSLINKWTRDYAYDMNVIGVACERTVLNTDKRRFNYADSILTKWHEMGIRNKSDIDTLDPAKKKVSNRTSADSRNRFNQFTANDYDFDALEKKLISN